MNASDARLFELALKKQGLLFASAQLRESVAHNLTALTPLCTGVDQARAAGHWLRQHPAIPVAIGVALAVARPRRAWRWARRSLIAWQAWQRLRRLMEPALNARR